ncbi:uncharacterized protein LOC132183934 [Corylus avellana]|uniref:uncharacterized protein LOC132183934 n=1 Tax=Corylus avellana TaxID=13451 RepID=UPI00286B7CD9|nr:uncharacterized protein LOC132183934 [Corylus avellana]
MKAKYNLRSSILEASSGNRPSYAWRSIQRSYDLLKEGLIWRIGNGSSVKIWGEKWIPKPNTYKVQSHPHTLDRESVVSVLIDLDTRWWNQPLLKEIFTPEEITLIQTIPIGGTSQRNLQIWRGTTSGIFTVRSVYHLVKKITTGSKAETPSRDSDSPVWQGLWGLTIANASKNFMWRACHDLLPTRNNLVRKKITIDPMCLICGREVETTFHIIWACSSLMDVWSGGSRTFQKFIPLSSDLLLLAEGIYQKCEREEFTIFVETLRKIWFRRNRWIHEGVFTPPNEVHGQDGGDGCGGVHAV